MSDASHSGSALRESGCSTRAQVAEMIPEAAAAEVQAPAQAMAAAVCVNEWFRLGLGQGKQEGVHE